MATTGQVNLVMASVGGGGVDLGSKDQGMQRQPMVAVAVASSLIPIVGIQPTDRAGGHDSGDAGQNACFNDTFHAPWFVFCWLVMKNTILVIMIDVLVSYRHP